MLVLTMKLGEKVLIGDRVEVVLLKLRGSQAKLGFTAPLDVEIDRDVVRDRKQLERGLRHG